uniref:Receptor transporter protein 3 n=1 Tax=Microcebus murinus TaxID=30608 RepID=A0A8C5Y0X3_MICMU
MALDAEVWKQVFQELIQEVKPWHRWTLTPDKGLLPDVLKPGWMQYQQWVFARFQCSSCSRSWASAQVQVLFHMHWSEEKSRGQVKMRVFAQRCKKCSQPPFEVPEFTLENISRILNNLVLRILKKCYRERFKSMEEIPMIKEVSLEGPHDRDNCEACLQGCCAEPTQAMSLPTSWIPRANATCPSGEHFSSYAPRSHTRRNIVGTCCCLLLLIVVVVVIIKTL